MSSSKHLFVSLLNNIESILNSLEQNELREPVQCQAREESEYSSWMRMAT